ncbi:membrane protein [Spirochaetia bacterium]|nr:membrane protein [Spirochaetia bacterium]
MKQGSFRAVCLILLACTAIFFAFGDDNTVNSESVVIDSFDDSGGAHEWIAGGTVYSSEFQWRVDASKFATKTEEESYPKLTYVAASPQALRQKQDDQQRQSLGIWGRFDRRGYNWIDVYPVEAGGGDEAVPFEIPLPGRVQALDCWVWGPNLNFYIEAYFRDNRGVVHSVRIGDLKFTGWKNMRVSIPARIPQSKQSIVDTSSIKFVKFRIWTQPTERVDNFYVYFDQLKVQTDTFESIFDGDELSDPERVQGLWSAQPAPSNN